MGQYLVSEFCKHAFPPRRKGGLIGLASMAISMEHQFIQHHVSELVPPVLTCFSDEDSSVRYSACEAFYNIAKVARGGIIPHFDAVFDGLCRLYTDVAQDVKDGVHCLDRLVRDIVTESRNFSYDRIVPLLTTRIHVLNPSVWQLVLGWIQLLDSVPEVDMIAYLPKYLKGLFGILATDKREIRHAATSFLSELLVEIRGSRPYRAQRAIAECAPVVARCCSADECRPETNFARLTALDWLFEFVAMQAEFESAASNETDMLSPQLEGGSKRGPQMVVGGLQLGPDVQGRQRGDVGKVGGLRQLIPVLLEGALHCLDDSEAEIQQKAQHNNDALMNVAEKLGEDLPVQRLVTVVLDVMRSGHAGHPPSETVLLACFNWIRLLITRCCDRILQPPEHDKLLDGMLGVLKRPENEIAGIMLRLIAQLVAMSGRTERSSASASGPGLARDDLLTTICERLFRLIEEDKTLLDSRWELAVRELCRGVDDERFYATAAGVLAHEKDLTFARRLVYVLNRVLLTCRETRRLRARLRADSVHVADAAPEFLMKLVNLWFNCPVSAIALCLWLHWFDLSADLVARLATMPMTEELETQLKAFIELFESPVFMRVRLQLLATRTQPALLRAVMGIVVLLPQEKALHARLEIVTSQFLLDSLSSKTPLKSHVVLGALESAPVEINPSAFSTKEHLLKGFDSVVDAHGWCKCMM